MSFWIGLAIGLAIAAGVGWFFYNNKLGKIKAAAKRYGVKL